MSKRDALAGIYEEIAAMEVNDVLQWTTIGLTSRQISARVSRYVRENLKKSRTVRIVYGADRVFVVRVQ